jgi:hypothetical protein
MITSNPFDDILNNKNDKVVVERRHMATLRMPSDKENTNTTNKDWYSYTPVRAVA